MIGTINGDGNGVVLPIDVLLVTLIGTVNGDGDGNGVELLFDV